MRSGELFWVSASIFIWPCMLLSLLGNPGIAQKASKHGRLYMYMGIAVQVCCACRGLVAAAVLGLALKDCFLPQLPILR